MTTVFSAIAMPKGGPGRLFRKPDLFKQFLSPEDSCTTNTLTPVDELPADDQDAAEPDLQNLNTALAVLVQVFPDVQPEVFREMLMNLSKESRVEVVTEHMLKDKGKWVNGRYRVLGSKSSEKRKQQATEDESLAVDDTFRSQVYRQAVKQAFYQEFKGLSHSVVKAVLAEQNHSYTRTRPILQQLASQSWRHYFTNFWTRKQRPSAELQDHPLIEWRSITTPTGIDQLRPFMRPTPSRELNVELYTTIAAPALAKQNQVVYDRDVVAALQLNEDEAEEAGAQYECECCYVSYAFEQMATCDTGGHFICFNCIRHAINEALFGQGWARNVSNNKMSVRCLAPCTDECTGCVPSEIARRAFVTDKDGEQTWQKFEDRVASDEITKSQLPLLRCPFCSYAEVDEASQLKFRTPLAFSEALVKVSRLRTDIFFEAILALVVFYTGLVIYPLAYLVLVVNSFFAPSDFANSRLRVSRRRRGLKFWCRSPTCRATSCSLCCARWTDPHVCHENSATSLRQAIEAATTTAVKRTCPKCSLSFVKSSGCNHLVCNCGYHMCYVCRNEIGKESYGHFCQHFRQQPGRCTECNRCDLYIVENEEAVIRRAAEMAEKQWREKEGKVDLHLPVGFGEFDVKGHRLALVREEVLKGIKHEEGWRFDVVVDGLLEALSA